MFYDMSESAFHYFETSDIDALYNMYTPERYVNISLIVIQIIQFFILVVVIAFHFLC